MFRPEAHPTERTTDQEFAVLSLQKDGVPNLALVPPNDFIGDDGEGTVDGVHYTDIGMQRQAQSLFPIVAKVLGEAGATKGDGEKPHARNTGDLSPVKELQAGKATQ